ncbi:hypothetical protein INT45_005157 [Circinella minor]|uniref:Enhancer of polycomb-like protein n=1 Tax=Circinella minor TaxID=1195481 RepID=A0A8H7VB92_9FUNG|nr:hypothetical protein INT45_005157 [Circinella minor]
MTNQMVSRFREKKVSYKKAMTVYKTSQPDVLKEAVDAQRSVGNIESGVEKEEEDEYDLQAVLSEAKTAVKTGQEIQRFIPTPDATKVISNEDYDRIYKRNFLFKKPTSYIRFSMTVEDMIKGGDQYFMDEKDDIFLKKYNDEYKNNKLSEDKYEDIMHQIESVVSYQLPHLSLDPLSTPEPNELLKMLPDSFHSLSSSLPNIFPILEHWRSRRLAQGGKPIIPQLQYEDILKNEIDPYVCFRRRETKPVRKTRRTDQQSLERLRKLRNDMEKARNLFEMVLRREKFRKETLVQDYNVFDKKCEIRNYQKRLNIVDEEALNPISRKKRKTSTDAGSSTTIKIPRSLLRQTGGEGLDRHDKSPIQLALESELAKKREEDAAYEDVTECSYQPFPMELPLQFFQSLSNNDNHNNTNDTPCFRKRIGRGGRVFIDRIGRQNHHYQQNHVAPHTPDPFAFDSDYMEMDDDLMELDETDNRFLRHRAQLLSTEELRNFFPDIPRQVARKQPFTPVVNNNNTSGPSSTSSVTVETPRATITTNNNTGANGNTSVASPIIVKRQNSRQRKTPQQASEEMAKGMLTANLSAVVNKVTKSHQQQMPLQNHKNNNGPSPLQQPTPPPQKSSTSPSPPQQYVTHVS